jgi:hypothetical protein
MAIMEGSCYNNSKKLMKRVRTVRHCGYYSEKGYNSCTYTVKIKDIDDSDTSKE